MNELSQKVYLQFDPPTEEAPASDRERLREALRGAGYGDCQVPLHVLRKLYPACRAGHGITVTLVWKEGIAVVADLETGDTVRQHFGLAVDYGSTTVHMQMVDLNA